MGKRQKSKQVVMREVKVNENDMIISHSNSLNLNIILTLLDFSAFLSFSILSVPLPLLLPPCLIMMMVKGW